MRYGYLLFSACLPFLAGCSSLIAGSGTEITEVSRQEIHARFGEPKASGMEEGRVWEDYHTRIKIADPYLGPGYGFAYVMTLGLVEFVWFPEELARLTWGTIVGREVRFVYDDSGRVTYAWIDGQGHRACSRTALHQQAAKKSSLQESQPVVPASATVPSTEQLDRRQ